MPRQQSDGCDSEGNLITSGNEVHVYDAASKQLKFEDWRYTVGGSPNHLEVHPTVDIQQTYDSDGRPTKRIETRRTEELIGSGPNTNILTTATYTYYVYSTVLGGAKLIELGGGAGHVSTTYVYANGWRIAKQNIQLNSSDNWVSWSHVNPGSNSFVESFRDASIRVDGERDPDGAETGTEDPWANVELPTYENLKDEEPLYIEGGDPFDYTTGLTIDGLPVSQAEFNRRTQNGSAGVQVSRGGRPVAFVTNQQQLQHITVDVFQVDDELRNLPQSQRWGGTYYVGSFDINLAIIDQDRVGPTKVKSEVWSAAPDVQGIRADLDKMLKTGGCGQFIEDLLNRLSTTKNPRVAGSALDLYDMVTKQKGLVRGGLATKYKVGATIDGNLVRDNGKKPGNASIHIGTGFVLPPSPPDARISAVNALDAFQVLHELVHLAGQKKYYRDVQVAKVLSDWLKVPGLPKRSDYNSEWEFTGANSTYFSTVLKSKCPPL